MVALKWTGIYLACAVASYLIAAFVYAEPNAMAWSPESRGVLLWVAGWLTAMVFIERTTRP